MQHRVLIADDHPAARAGIRRSLAGHGFVVCAEVADAPTAIAAALRERPDICLLDVSMPGGGIHAAGQITSKLTDTAVVMLSISDASEDLFDSLRAGATGYLLKDTSPERLPFALKGVIEGQAALPRPLVMRLIDEFRWQGKRRRVLGPRGAEVSAREWQVLEMLHAGLTTAEVARRLEISPVTVRRHVSSMIKKLGAPDRAAAIALLDED